jgi:hypothetical protein
MEPWSEGYDMTRVSVSAPEDLTARLAGLWIRRRYLPG